MINLYQGKAITTKADIWVGTCTQIPHPPPVFGLCGLLKLCYAEDLVWLGRQHKPRSKTGFLQKLRLQWGGISSKGLLYFMYTSGHGEKIDLVKMHGRRLPLKFTNVKCNNLPWCFISLHVCL